MLQLLGMAQHGSFPSQRRTVDSTPYFTIDVQSGLSYKHCTERPRLPSLRPPPPKGRGFTKAPLTKKNRGFLARLTYETPSLPRTHTSRVHTTHILSHVQSFLWDVSISLSQVEFSTPRSPPPPTSLHCSKYSYGHSSFCWCLGPSLLSRRRLQDAIMSDGTAYNMLLVGLWNIAIS